VAANAGCRSIRSIIRFASGVSRILQTFHLPLDGGYGLVCAFIFSSPGWRRYSDGMNEPSAKKSEQRIADLEKLVRELLARVKKLEDRIQVLEDQARS
jgi:hypothetical protein